MAERVFVSSTYEDLKEHRANVLNQLQRLGMTDVAMEHYSADERRPLDRCLEDVRSCDLQVTILAWRYGFVPTGQTQSITELEYREAGAHGIDRLVFLLSEATPWLPTAMDMSTGEGDGGRYIKQLREELAAAHTVSFFSTKESLASELAAAISQWRSRHELRTAATESAARPDTLRDYLESMIALDLPIERFYVDLEGTTKVAHHGGGSDWPDRLLPAAFLAAVPAEAKSSIHEIDNLQQALQLHSRFVLLGDSGSGKTTTLHRLRIAAARTALETPAAPVPLLIKLSEWPASITEFASLLVHEREVQGVPLLNPSRLLLLIDGLNEIHSDLYDARVGLLGDWLRQNTSVRMVIGTRARHYQQQRQLPLPTVRIHPLNETRIQDFARKFLGASAGADLVSELGAGLLHLARSPFLLGLLCYLYQRHGGTLPRTRSMLLRTTIQTLFLREQERGNASGMSLETLIDALGTLALGVVHSRSATSVSLEWARKRLPVAVDADRLVRLATNAELIELSKNNRFLQFSHQLYLEHFAAEHLGSQLARLATALPEPIFAHGDRVGRLIDEVVNALVGLGEADAVLAEIAKRDPFLAADALAVVEGGEITAATVEEIVRYLLEQLDHSDDDRRTAAATRLIHLGDAAVPGWIRILRSAGVVARRIALSALGQMGSLDALEAVVRALLDENRWVRRGARTILSDLDAEERMLILRYLDERLPAVADGERQRLAAALANCWRGHEPDLYGELRERFAIADVEPETAAADGGGTGPLTYLEPGWPEPKPEDVPNEEQPVAQRFFGRNWPFMWAKLVRHAGADAKLLRKGRTWLQGRPPSTPGWAMVWAPLVAASPEDSRLLDLGWQWLEPSFADRESWPRVWMVLWHHAPEQRSRLADAATRWLISQPPVRRGASKVWLTVWPAVAGDEELVRWAAAFRLAAPEHPDLPQIAAACPEG